jgi:hypothetical protein
MTKGKWMKLYGMSAAAAAGRKFEKKNKRRNK